MPYDEVDFSRVLDALSARGFIEKHAFESGFFGVIPSFAKHQAINNRERGSELPEPSEISLCDACSTRDGRDGHAGQVEGKGKEGNKEGKGKEGGVRKARATLEELRSYAVEQGHPASDGESMFDHWEANGWRNGQNPVKDWQAGFRKWKSQGWLPSQKTTLFGTKPLSPDRLPNGECTEEAHLRGW
jgi:hypothetical protein